MTAAPPRKHNAPEPKQAEGPAFRQDDPPQSASEVVFWGIVRGVEEQQFVPGQRLIEHDLAARFHVGRNAVREAMQRLAAEGLVNLSRHKGATIRVLSLQEALDLLDIVERIFGLLTRTAARGSTDPQHTTALEQAMDALQAADDQRDAYAFSRARRFFYRTLLNMGGNQDLKRLFTTLHIPIIYAQQRVPALQNIRLRDYRQIAAAVLAGDADAADQAGAGHVQNVRQALLGASQREAAASEQQSQWV